MITNEIKMTISYNTHDAENNTQALTSSPLDLSKYSSWEEIREELANQGFVLEEFENCLVVENLQNISEEMFKLQQWHPKHVFNLLNAAGVLTDGRRFETMKAVAEVRGLDEFADLVEHRGDAWDEGIYIYEGYDWYDFGKMVCEVNEYKIPKNLEYFIDYEAYGESFSLNANVYSYSNGIIELAY